MTLNEIAKSFPLANRILGQKTYTMCECVACDIKNEDYKETSEVIVIPKTCDVCNGNTIRYEDIHQTGCPGGRGTGYKK